MQKEIDKAKQSLINKAKSKGLYENFGQKEVRKLQDKFGYTKEVAEFDEWASNYSIK